MIASNLRSALIALLRPLKQEIISRYLFPRQDGEASSDSSSDGQGILAINTPTRAGGIQNLASLLPPSRDNVGTAAHGFLYRARMSHFKLTMIKKGIVLLLEKIDNWAL